ncbi:MAG TPA: diguanylate cyclase [Ideonella sp.]|nr:diguanylate cyclase [Ideonella sp.]
MPLFRQLSLRQLLTLPYVVLVLLLSVVLGSLSYGAGRDAVDNLSDQLLVETVGRISQAVEQHIFGTGAVLEMAFPKGVDAPERIVDEIEALRTRFWLATSVHRELNNYAYYGDDKGHFFGLWRDAENEAQLRLRLADSGPRTLYRFQGIHGKLTDPMPEERVFEPRERPWYRAARGAPTETWTSIYIDFRTNELVATRARKVPGADGSFKGVVATDVSLQHLTNFARALPLSRNGLAFVVEPNGNLIATSRGDHIRRGPDGSHARLNAADSSDPLLAATYREVQALMKGSGAPSQARARKITMPDGTAVQVAYARIRDSAGLDWIIAVAVPRHDFLQQITTNLYQALLLSLLAAGAVVAVGLISLGVVARDLRKLATAARQVGDGDFDTPLRIDRRDEIGDLAQSFSTMKHKLSTDRLTGLANREALMRRIEDRILLQRRGADPRPFVLLFLDVDGFKAVNDRFGHDAGDRVLRELGQRMLAALRERDIVARWAGDEFLVMLDTVDSAADSHAVSAKLHEAFTAPLACLPPGSEVSLGVSIGMAVYPDDAQDVDTLVQRADEDMYRKKRAAG